MASKTPSKDIKLADKPTMNHFLHLLLLAEGGLEEIKKQQN